MSEENNNPVQEQPEQEQPEQEQSEQEQSESSQFKVDESEQVQNQNSEVIEVPWERLESTFQLREALRETQSYTSDFLLQTERRKKRLLAEIDNIERTMYDAASAIRSDLSLNPEWTYEFKLPTNAGEKGYFVRKEQDPNTI